MNPTNEPQAIGMACIDRTSLEESGVLLILHYKPLKSIDDVNVDTANDYMKELEADEEFKKIANGCMLMVLPTHGLLADLYTLINVSAPPVIEKKKSGLVSADGTALSTDTDNGVFTQEDSSIPMSARMLLHDIHNSGR